MTNRQRHNGLLSGVLLAVAGIWIWLVTDTIRGGFGGGDVGPRAFPLAFGILLAVLAGLLLVRVVMSRPGTPEVLPDQAAPHFTPLPAVVVLAEVFLYGFLMQKLGFLIATTAIVLIIMLFNLKLRSVWTIIGITVGVPVGTWLMFEKVLGIYLANGSWINLG